MKRKLYVIYDRVAMESGPIFEAKNDGIARRQFENAMENQRYAHEQALLRVGEINHETNLVVGEIPAVEVAFDAEGEDEEVMNE